MNITAYSLVCFFYTFGFSENVDIDGESYSNVIPSHDFLKDKEIADVLTYVRKAFDLRLTFQKLRLCAQQIKSNLLLKVRIS